MKNKKENPRLTPMMKQYLSIKQKHQDEILFFRMGDFYETFYEDAAVASRVLGIALTSRAREGEKKIPLAGVPHHAVDTYIARLVRAGHKVVICDQVENPKEAKGLVKRKVVEVITPGTVTSSLLLEDKENNYLVAIMSEDERWGMARADLSTGEFMVSEISTNDLFEELAKTAPSEILFPRADSVSSITPGVPDSASSMPISSRVFLPCITFSLIIFRMSSLMTISPLHIRSAWAANRESP